MYHVYILYSPGHGITYTGHTANLEERLIQHNQTLINSYTAKYRPWILIHSEQYSSRSAAMKREKWYKTGVGRDRIKVILEAFLTGQDLAEPLVNGPSGS